MNTNRNVGTKIYILIGIVIIESPLSIVALIYAHFIKTLNTNIAYKFNKYAEHFPSAMMNNLIWKQNQTTHEKKSLQELIIQFPMN